MGTSPPFGSCSTGCPPSPQSRAQRRPSVAYPNPFLLSSADSDLVCVPAGRLFPKLGGSFQNNPPLFFFYQRISVRRGDNFRNIFIFRSTIPCRSGLGLVNTVNTVSLQLNKLIHICLYITDHRVTRAHSLFSLCCLVCCRL